MRVDALPDDYRAEGVAAAMAEVGITGKRILLPRAGGAREVLPLQLQGLGALVEEVVTYITVPARSNPQELRDLLLRGQADLITFTSSSTVHNFAKIFEGQLSDVLRHAAIGCIGPITAETARSYGMRVTVQPRVYTVPALVDAIVRYYAQSGRTSE